MKKLLIMCKCNSQLIIKVQEISQENLNIKWKFIQLHYLMQIKHYMEYLQNIPQLKKFANIQHIYKLFMCSCFIVKKQKVTLSIILLPSIFIVIGFYSLSK